MKRQFLIIILMTLLFSSSCQSSSVPHETEYLENLEREYISEGTSAGASDALTEICGYKIYFHYTKEYPINFDLNVDSYEGNVVPDKEAAVCITKQIFDCVDKPSAYDAFEPTMLTYDASNMIWIVTFKDPADFSEEYIVAGNAYNIAIQQKDGKVLWMGPGE